MFVNLKRNENHFLLLVVENVTPFGWMIAFLKRLDSKPRRDIFYA